MAVNLLTNYICE